MADDIERANSSEEFLRNVEIGNRKDEGSITHNGTCHYCDEDIESPKLFCNGECATDYDKDNR